MLLSYLLRHLVRRGTLRIIDAGGRIHSVSGEAGPSLTLRFHDPALLRTLFFYPRLALGDEVPYSLNELGLGESQVRVRQAEVDEHVPTPPLDPDGLVSGGPGRRVFVSRPTLHDRIGVTLNYSRRHENAPAPLSSL